MTVNYTTNLALGQPVTGTESGTWGDDVNNSVTSYLDIAIAGGLAITVTTTDVTLTLTQGTSSATNIGSTTAQYAILNVSGAMTAASNLILPSSSRQYVINNNTTGGFALTVKGSATSGVTMVNGEKAHVFWNGSDYAKLSNTPGGAGTFSSITNTGLTSGRVVYSTTGGLETDSANLTFDGTNLGLAGGTANGVAYLNGSKVLTTGSALTFDGTNFATTGFIGTAAGYTVGGLKIGGYLAVASQTTNLWFGDISNNFSSGVAFYSNGSEQMRLTSTGLGIGTPAPAYKLDVLGTQRIYQSSNTAASISLSANQGALGTGYLFNLSQTNSSGGYAFTISEASTTYLTLTNSASGSGGNLGLGVTPSASNLATIQSDYGIISGNSGINIAQNAYYNSGWKYTATAVATRYAQSGGIHYWYNAPSGTAGNAITFTQAMTLDASGNLGIGTSSPSTKLVVNGGTSTSQIRWNVSNAAYVEEVSTNAAVSAYVYKQNDASYHAWMVSSSTAMTLATSGNLGIGIPNPARKLVVSNASAAGFEVGPGTGPSSGNEFLNYNRSTSAYLKQTTYSSEYLFYAGAGASTTALAIDTSGNLGIGIGSVATNFRTQFLGTAGSNTSAASSGTTQSASAVLRLQAGGGFTGTLDIGQGGGTGSWLQSTDTGNLATTYPLLLNPVGGSVGINTTAPSTYGKLGLSVSATASAVTKVIGFQNSAGVDAASLRIAGYNYVDGVQTAIDFIQNSASDFKSQIAFSTNAGSGLVEAMRINSSGYVGIGASTTAQLRSQLTVLGAGQTTAALSDSGNTDGTIQINSNVNAGNRGGALTFGALLDNATYTPFAAIKGLLTNGGGNGTGDLAFSVRNATGNSTLTEAMRIAGGGLVFINRTTDLGNGILQISGIPDSRVAIQTYQNATTSQAAIWFNNPNGNVGSISTSGSVTSYNVTSDQRLKENIQDADSASALIDSLQVRKFDWKTDNTHQRYGFIAQELVTVAPEAVHQPVNEDDMMAVDYSKLVPMLVKEIQSLRKRLAALESKEIS